MAGGRQVFHGKITEPFFQEGPVARSFKECRIEAAPVEEKSKDRRGEKTVRTGPDTDEFIGKRPVSIAPGRNGEDRYPFFRASRIRAAV